MSNSLKRSNVLIEQLCKQYCDSYSPVLLPKIAKYGFRVKGSPMAVSFAAKMKLYDPVTLKRENSIVKKVKMKQNLQKLNGRQTSRATMFRKQIKNQQNNLSLQMTQNVTNSSKNPQKTISTLNLVSDRPQTNFSRLRTQQSKQLTGQNQNWDEVMSNYQQLYEYARIMGQRHGDLVQFVGILKEMNIDVTRFQNVKAEMEASIVKTNRSIEEILPEEMFHKSMNVEEETKKFAWLKRKTKKVLHQDDTSVKMKLMKNIKSRISTEPYCLDKIGQKSKKFDFLKRKSSHLFKLKDPLLKNQSNFKKGARDLMSIRPQKSFALKICKEDKQSKNTQQKLSQDLEQEYEQKMLQKSEKLLTKDEDFRSQKYLHEVKVTKDRNIRTWNHLTLDDEKLMRLNLMNGIRFSGLHSMKASKRNGTGSSRSSVLSKAQKETKEPATSRFSHIRNHDKTLKSLKSHMLESRSSFTSNSGSKATLGMKKNLQRPSNQSLNDELDKKNLFKGNQKRKKIRVGQLKKDSEQNEGDQKSEVSIKEAIINDEGPDRHAGGRRKGRAIPTNMNTMFQRILQDDSIQKIIQSNRERETQKLLQATSKKKVYQSVLKRRNRASESTISGVNSSVELAEQYFRGMFRLQKPREIPYEDKQHCRVNYSDILQLQKSLRPIASYNESKMITRYSTEPEETQQQNFQFKYKHGKLVFNHEFHLRKENDYRKNFQEDFVREKSVKEENSKIDFMKRFKKCLERCDQPLQKGFDEGIVEGF